MIPRIARAARLSRALLLGVASLLLARCSPVDLLNATIDTDGLVVEHAIAYGDGPRRKLDVYRPALTAGALPMVVFFYGGAWQTGAREDYVFVAASLARAGMVVVVPDYRLSPEVRFPAFVQDAAQAVAYAEAHAAAWGAEPARIVLAGHSAGAHIAAMLALDPVFLAAAGASRDRLAGAVGISGPYDFLPITGADIKRVFAGSDPASTQPISFVDGRNPPMLLLHGTADDTVYLKNTVNLADAIRQAGGRVEVRTYEGVGHIGAVLGFAPLFRGRSPVLADMVGFVRGLAPRG